MIYSILTTLVTQEPYASMDAVAAAEALNTKQVIGVAYRRLTAEEVLDALGQAKIAAYVDAAEDTSTQAAEKHVPAAALSERLATVGELDVTPGCAGRAEVDALVTTEVWEQSDVDALVALSQYTIEQTPAEEAGAVTPGELVYPAQIRRVRSQV